MTDLIPQITEHSIYFRSIVMPSIHPVTRVTRDNAKVSTSSVDMIKMKEYDDDMLQKFPCIYRSKDPVRTETCKLCSMKGYPAPIYSCAIKTIQECTVRSFGVLKDDVRMTVCYSCEERKESDETKSSN